LTATRQRADIFLADKKRRANMKSGNTPKELFDLSQPETAEAFQQHLLGNRAAARVAFEKLAAREPKNYFFHYILGETKYAMGLLDEAVGHYKTAIEVKPDFGVAFYKMGVCYHRMGQLENSLECFSKLLAMNDQGHAMASYFYGLINQLLGNDEEAENGFSILRKESRQSLIANYYLAQLKLKQGKYPEALVLLDELLRATPGLAEARYLEGMVFMAMHRNMEAIGSFRKTLELNPGDKRARGNLEMLTEVPEP
jgi:tetratricopeptide (TPR) repeat protein